MWQKKDRAGGKEERKDGRKEDIMYEKLDRNRYKSRLWSEQLMSPCLNFFLCRNHLPAGCLTHGHHGAGQGMPAVHTFLPHFLFIIKEESSPVSQGRKSLPGSKF